MSRWRKSTCHEKSSLILLPEPFICLTTLVRYLTASECTVGSNQLNQPSDLHGSRIFPCSQIMLRPYVYQTQVKRQKATKKHTSLELFGNKIALLHRKGIGDVIHKIILTLCKCKKRYSVVCSMSIFYQNYASVSQFSTVVTLQWKVREKLKYWGQLAPV